MKMNTTETMTISRTTMNPTFKMTLGDEEVEQLKRLVYLGQQITEEGTFDSDIIRRIEVARRACS